LHQDFSVQLRREVYGFFGIPIDAVDMPAVLRRIEDAISGSNPFLISTVNLNFLNMARNADGEFRDSLLISDLCTADGMPIVWLARLLGVPIKQRIAGSDIFERLKSEKFRDARLKVFFFGGDEGVAATACKRINTEAAEMTCVGSLYPGFGTLDEMSTSGTVETINNSGANFLAVALGARKGQLWLRRNQDRLRVPVRAHLGATLNFQAGTLKRAPGVMQRLGIEWLWRIKEEPELWRRYWNDGLALIQLVLTCVLPLLIMGFSDRSSLRDASELKVIQTDNHDSVTIALNGFATAETVAEVLPYFESAVAASKSILINFTDTRQIDARFLGLILMLNEYLKKQGQQLRFAGASSRLARIFRLNGFGFLLNPTAK